MPVPRALVWSEMQTTLSRIWTQVINSISYDDNFHTKSTSLGQL